MINKPGKIATSDTTAITYLSQINAIGLLKSLFKTIYIPEAVFHELTRQGIRVAGMLDIFKMTKERNIIPAVEPYLNKLRLTSFKLSPILYNIVLEDVGEGTTIKKA